MAMEKELADPPLGMVKRMVGRSAAQGLDEIKTKLSQNIVEPRIQQHLWRSFLVVNKTLILSPLVVSEILV